MSKTFASRMQRSNSLAQPLLASNPWSTKFWRGPVAAAALCVALGLASTDASALALGRITVLSALGETLIAEIDIPEITADEAASLRTTIANPEAFKAAGLDYNSALSGAQITLQGRANGTVYLRLSSDRVINEPFIDLIIEANWASGRIVRDYTMLFDPISVRAASAPTLTAPARTTAPAAAAAAAAPAATTAAPATASTPAAAPATAPTPATPSAATAQSNPRPARPEPAQKPVATAPREGVTVKPGDTAGSLATRFKPEGISLDQMLVAMLSTSPDAFTDDNVNRLKSGAVIDMQAAAAAAPNETATQAKQTIATQAKDFNAFRRRLAQSSPSTGTDTPSRADSGQVQTKVSEPKAQSTAADKLTLSKANAAAKAQEEQIAKDKQAKANETRVAELSKNIQDLNKLNTPTVAKPVPVTPATGSAPAVASTPATTKSTGGLPVPVAAPTVPAIATPVVTATAATPSPAPATAPATPTPASNNSISGAPTATATTTDSSTTASTAVTAEPAPPPAPAPAPAPIPKPVTPPAPAESSFLDSLLENPLVIPGAGALLALLGGLAFWRIRQRRKAGQVDSSFLESRLQPDSFFGASGGQRVDTADSNSAVGAGSSMVYSPSQLDAAGDVDPVAEADVYLAYGRDLQAEEILKEAIRSNPSRVAIHAKLMEIYHKRRDLKAFDTIAKQAYSITKGDGAEWDAASALGRELDPANPLYVQGGKPAAAVVAAAPVAAAAVAAATNNKAKAAPPQGFSDTSTLPLKAQQAADDNFDIDLDLDFSTGGEPPAGVSKSAAAAAMSSPAAVFAQVTAANAQAEPSVDFDMSVPARLEDVKLSEPDLAAFSKGLNFTNSVGAAPTEPMALQTASSTKAVPLEFDLGDISLDLADSDSGKLPVAQATGGDDPMETKMALAVEFANIGDVESTRSILQEVIEGSNGPLKARAMKMLANMG